MVELVARPTEGRIRNVAALMRRAGENGSGAPRRPGLRIRPTEGTGRAEGIFQKWIPEICERLSRHPALRYTELQQGLPGIGSKTLAQKLRRLSRLGLVERRWFDEIPPHVEYSLTDRGQDFAQKVVAIRKMELGDPDADRWL